MVDEETLREILIKVKDLCISTGKILLDEKEFSIELKGEFDYVTEMDKKVSSILCNSLPKIIPNSTVISEEEDLLDQGSEYTWIIDPIDGTLNFIHKLNDWAISIALVTKNESILGVVYNPLLNEMFFAIKGHGAFLNGEKICVSQEKNIGKSAILCETNPYGDRNERGTFKSIFSLFSKCSDVRVLGSAALDICYVACGRADCAMAQNLKEWDFAAGIIILEESGGRITDWKGNPVSIKETKDIIASNTLLHSTVCNLLS